MICLLWVLTFLLGNVYSYTLRGSLDQKVLPLSTYDVSVTRFILQNKQSLAQQTAFIRTNGEFVFSNLSEGSYLLSMESVTLQTKNKYLINIADSEVQVREAYDGHDVVTDLGPRVSYPIIVEPIVRPEYVIKRESFSLISMLKSPMMLLSIGAMFMVFIMPKLAENIDPETVEQVNQHYEDREAAMSKVSNFDVAQFMAEKSKKN